MLCVSAFMCGFLGGRFGAGVAEHALVDLLSRMGVSLGVVEVAHERSAVVRCDERADDLRQSVFGSQSQSELAKESGVSANCPSWICASIIWLTMVAMDSSVYSFRLRLRASTASAIISIAASLVAGLGPG